VNKDTGMDQRQPASDRRGPGFTMVENYFFDNVMRKAGGVEWKVICTVIRDTFGWEDDETASGRREEAEIPIERFVEMTGAKRSRLFEAVNAACRRGVIKRPEQRAFRFRPMPRANLQKVSKQDPRQRNQQTLPGLSENRTLQSPEIGLPESENRTEPILRKKVNKQWGFAPPFQSQAFLSALADFERHRREHGNKLTPTALKGLYERLAELGEERATKILLYSTAQGYIGLHEERNATALAVHDIALEQREPQLTIRERLERERVG